MDKEKLLRNISSLGFSLFETDKRIDVNETIYQTLKSGNLRFLEGFPVILANAIKHPGFDVNALLNICKSEDEKRTLMQFIILSISLYKYFHLKFWWADKMYKKMSDENKEIVNSFLQYLKKDDNFKIMEYTINSAHIKDVFKNYFQYEESNTEKTKSNYEQLSLEFALSHIFSPKQKALFFKKLNGEKMTKTEREYYYRRVKKKIAALANSEVHSLSKKILGY